MSIDITFCAQIQDAQFALVFPLSQKMQAQVESLQFIF